MAVQAPGWERRLIDRAYEALESQIASALHITSDDRALAAAYATCGRITKAHSRTFFMASGLLPRDKRRSARALYAFCRAVDNLVDAHDSAGDPSAGLQQWRDQLAGQPSSGDDPVAMAWADTRARYRIPWRYAEQLIEGVGRDLVEVRYATFDELAEYCYGVASTVGLMAMHIVGFADARAIPYAVKLGVALQLTNILRDIAEDWRAGRLYLPQEELASFGLDEAVISAGAVDDRWRAFMHFQIERNRRLYAEAMPGIALLAVDGRVAIAAAAELYQGILRDIEAHDYDVFGRRAYVSTWGKLSRLPGIWLRAKKVQPMTP